MICLFLKFSANSLIFSWSPSYTRTRHEVARWYYPCWGFPVEIDHDRDESGMWNFQKLREHSTPPTWKPTSHLFLLFISLLGPLLHSYRVWIGEQNLPLRVSSEIYDRDKCKCVEFLKNCLYKRFPRLENALFFLSLLRFRQLTVRLQVHTVHSYVYIRDCSIARFRLQHRVESTNTVALCCL
jgi:hypothetical protein